MPIEDGLRVYIYPGDHLPPHVHVLAADCEVVVLLGDEETMPSVREIRRGDRRFMRRALSLVCQNQELLLTKWVKHNGE